MSTGIYIIANKLTGKCYVGSSVDIVRRWKRHDYELRSGKHHSQKLQRSYAKCGESAFYYSVVEFCEKSDLTVREQHWIDRLDAYSAGYNACPNAGAVGRMPKTPEHRRRIGEAQLGRKRTTEAKARMSKAMSGKTRGPMSDELKAKISAALKGRKMTQEAKYKLSAAKTGVKTGPCSESRRAAISAAKRARDAARKEQSL